MVKDSKIYAIFAIIVLVVAGLFVFDTFRNKNEKDVSLESNYDSIDINDDSCEMVVREQEPIKFPWSYKEEKDPMTDKVKKFAMLRSMNSINQSFPYDGDAYLRVYIRKHEDTDIYFVIDKGQILCNEYNGTNHVKVRFGDDKPIRFNTVEPQSGSSELVFLQGGVQRFINLCKKNKEIKVEIPIYEYGNAVFNFYVTEPLEW